jgi:spermidine/putrescine transport system ATP-binding protein
MILSDRVVLLNKGGIEQIGGPQEMYWSPRTLFAAKFFGDTNIVNGTYGLGDTSNGFVDLPFGRYAHTAKNSLGAGPSMCRSVLKPSVLNPLLARRWLTAPLPGK